MWEVNLLYLPINWASFIVATLTYCLVEGTVLELEDLWVLEWHVRETGKIILVYSSLAQMVSMLFRFRLIMVYRNHSL